MNDAAYEAAAKEHYIESFGYEGWDRLNQADREWQIESMHNHVDAFLAEIGPLWIVDYPALLESGVTHEQTRWLVPLKGDD